MITHVDGVSLTTAELRELVRLLRTLKVSRQDVRHAGELVPSLIYALDRIDWLADQYQQSFRPSLMRPHGE